MNYVYAILQILNHPIHKEIKDGYTKGWQYTKSRKINNCIEIGFRCPRGKNIADAEKLLPDIRASCGTEIELMDYIGVIVVRVCAEPLPLMIPFLPKMLEGLKPSEILIGYDITGERITFDWSLPHGIVAAETGMGKTDFLRLLVYCLLQDPKPIDIRIIDMKMLSFLPFKNVRNITLGIGWDGAEKMLLQAAEEVNKRNKEVFESGSRKMAKALQKIVVIIDEAAEVAIKAATLPEEKTIAKKIEKSIITIARMGREVNVHLIYCTQYPTADIVSNQIRINCGMRLCFYVPEEVQSEVVLQRSGAEKLHAIKGRAIFKDNHYATVQVPFVGDDEVWESMLTPYKTEVIEDGKSARSDKERNTVEGSFTNTDRDNQTTGNTVFKQFEPTQKSQPTSSGTGARKNGPMGVVPPRKTLAIDLEGEKEIEWL